MIVDCHTHINRYEDENSPALPERLDALLLEMRKNRLDFCFILSSYKNVPGRPSLRAVVEAIRDIPNVFAVAGMSYLMRKDWDLGELRSFIQEGKVKGIKFYCGYEPFYPADKEMLPVVEIAKEFDIPVYVHTGDTFTQRGKLKYAHPLNIDDFAVDHPELKIIICHLGNPWVRDTMEVVYKNDNVYTDISGLVLGNFNDRFERIMIKHVQEMTVFGMNPKKVLYGTDWPISSMSSYLKFVEDLGYKPEDKRLVLGENAVKLFRLNPKDSPYFR
ncbi:MAG: amidohydrolase family protein [Bdellovibrionota bacterium]